TPLPPRPPKFGGETYEARFDEARLTGQLKRVWDAMKSGRWFTLGELRIATGGTDSEAGLSARIRDLRKAEFGGHTVERRRRAEPERGVWENRLIGNKELDN